MINLNFVIDNLTKSQASFYLIKELNKRHEDISPIVFVENLAPMLLRPSFPIMQIAELWNHTGTTIATTTATAFKILNYPGPTRRILYLWDIYWLRGRRRVYEPYVNLFDDKRLEIIVRSQSHKRVFENCFNRQVLGVVEDFNMEGFLEVLNPKEALSEAPV